MCMVAACTPPDLQPWHEERLGEEFDVRRHGKTVTSFSAYRDLEDAVFEELSRRIYGDPEHQAIAANTRYLAGGPGDTRSTSPDWNRSVEIPAEDPRGGVLLLHGMSDAPYSLSHFAHAAARENYHVLALRYPGHGTIPSGLRQVRDADLSAAVGLAAAHLREAIGDRPLHIVGYSTGAPLALEYAMDALESPSIQVPASLVFLSPAIRVHAAAGLAGAKNILSALPGLTAGAWLSLLPENDPHKYNSFTSNAAAQVHRLTVAVDRRFRRLPEATLQRMPPILALKSTVDSTVTTSAVVDNLLMSLQGEHELLLFDVNQYAIGRGQLSVNADAYTQHLRRLEKLPFTLTIVGNDSPDSRTVSAFTRRAGESVEEQPVPLNALARGCGVAVACRPTLSARRYALRRIAI